MKYLVILALFSSFTFAKMNEDVEVILNYDESYVMDSKSTLGHLRVVKENWSFPDRTSHERSQKEKFLQAFDAIEYVINTEEFKRRVLSYSRSSDGKREYRQNFLWGKSENKLTNEDIYNIVMNGDEKMRPDTIGEMNINSRVKKCRFYEKPWVWCRKVVGSTSPSNSKWMKLNWKFYKKYEIASMANNIVHEWVHLLGFLHGSRNIDEEAPYVIGSIIQELVEELY